ncbi:MAG: hypothetical protein U0869_13965 [Chloroflexota bacterium]
MATDTQQLLETWRDLERLLARFDLEPGERAAATHALDAVRERFRAMTTAARSSDAALVSSRDTIAAAREIVRSTQLRLEVATREQGLAPLRVGGWVLLRRPEDERAWWHRVEAASRSYRVPGGVPSRRWFTACARTIEQAEPARMRAMARLEDACPDCLVARLPEPAA